MKIEILEYIDDPRNMRKGLVDIKVIHNEEKWEIFRGLAYFEKEQRKWLTFPNTKREDKWVPYYERCPEVSKDILPLTLKALEEYLSQNKWC